MATIKKGSFSSVAISNNHKDVVKASATIQTYVQILLQQPDFDLSILDNLSKHLQKAQKDANAWNLNILPGLIKITADIIDYANTFQSFQGVLVKFAGELSVPDSKKKLIEGLLQLHKGILEKHDTAQAVQTQISDFESDLATDYQNFAHDAENAEAKIDGSSGKIKALKDEIDAINKAMNKDIGLMAGGAVLITAGVAAIVIGVVAEIPTAGVSTALVGGGMLGIAGGALLETFGAVDYSDKIDLLKDVTEMKSKEEAELAALRYTDSHLLSFNKAISSAKTATEALREGWLNLASTLSEVIQAIEKAADPKLSGEFTVAELQTANKDWKDALQLAKQLQPSGKVPIQVYKDVQDAFKSLKKA